MEIKKLIPQAMNPLSKLATTDQDGRLFGLMNSDKKGTVLKVRGAIMEAYVIVGLNIDEPTALLAAKEAISFILSDYKLAFLEDVLKAIKWGAFGKLSLNNQLTTISARNIYGWYKQFRQEYPEELCRPMHPKKDYTIPEPSELEKTEMAISFFKRFLGWANYEKETMAVYFYEDLQKKGVMKPPTSDQKIEAYRKELLMVFENPQKIQTSNLLHSIRAVRQYKELCMEEGMDEFIWPSFEVVKTNLAHLYAVKRAKTNWVLNFIHENDHQALLKKYSEYYQK